MTHFNPHSVKCDHRIAMNLRLLFDITGAIIAALLFLALMVLVGGCKP